MARRRKGNKLLGRILMISVGAHIIVVPILARFGAFEKIHRQMSGPTVTVVPAPPAEKIKDIAKKVEAKKSTAVTKKSGASTNHEAKSNLNQPHVVTSNVADNGSQGDQPGVDPNGSGKAGVVPTDKSEGNKGSTTIPESGSKSDVPTKEASKPKVEESTPPKVESTKVEPTKPVERPHTPVLIGAFATYQPYPEIPDEFRNEALDKTTTVLVEVMPDGTTGEVSVQESCGTKELDQIAVRAAMKWRFKAATRDGEPIKSHVRLHVQFKVEA